MSLENPPSKGVTDPISRAKPTEHEINLTNDLTRILDVYGLFETEQEDKKRFSVLQKLNDLVKEFVYQISKSQGLPEQVARDAGGKVFTFGSFHLGVHGAGADIDTLCVFPKHVKRSDFFTVMYGMLKKHPEVTELTSVPDAFVPVIKMHFSGVPIDFVCARLNVSRVPDGLDLSDNNLLIDLDERCVRSLNGSRVANEVLRLVPNIAVFQLALRMIKLWAKRREIYSNIMGFLGGVAWAMLVARVCQFYPNACAAAIVIRFFRIFTSWEWPHPVVLKPIEDGPLQVRVWNPELYPSDKSHRMPIITPAYPSMCATHNVTDSTMKIMIKEFERGNALIEKINLGSGTWDELLENSQFFDSYRHYLQVVASSMSAGTQLEWHGLVESRLRQLVLKLELVEMLDLVHPYIKGIDHVHYCFHPQESENVRQGSLLAGRTFSLDKSSSSADPRESLRLSNMDEKMARPVYTTSFFIGLSVQPKTDATTGRRKLNLSWPTNEFIKMVQAWDKFDESSMRIVVKNVSARDLKGSCPEGMEEDTLKRTQTIMPRIPEMASPHPVVDKPFLTNPSKKLRYHEGSTRSNGVSADVQQMYGAGIALAGTIEQ